jgi:carboxyl-terminal processing protease
MRPLTSAISLFQNEVIVTTKSRIEHNNTYRTTFEPVDTEIPLVIIINGKVRQHQKLFLGLARFRSGSYCGQQKLWKGLVQNQLI